MKPPAFTYHRPESLRAALEALAEAGPDGKVLAGGQSLVPMLNMRLAAPRHLIDVNRVQELAYVRTSPGTVTVGALARHAAVERDEPAFAAIPLLRHALATVAHPTIRNRGTTVGSIVHADPSGEMPAVLVLLDGTVTAASSQGTRTIAAADFFLAPLESALRPGELATEVTFTKPPKGTGTAWLEVSRRHGDYAVCGLGALVTADADGRIVTAKAAYISCGPVPELLDLTGPLAGSTLDSADWTAAGRYAESRLEPEADLHASAEYRRHLAGVLTARALATAAKQVAA